MIANLVKGIPILILNGWAGAIWYSLNSIPFWTAVLFLIAYGSIVTLFFFYGTGWALRYLERWNGYQAIQKKFFSNGFLNLHQRAHNWLTNFFIEKKNWIVLGVNFLGYLPLLSESTVAAARIMKIKNALAILLINNIIRSLVLGIIAYRFFK